jgi:hypothetical protein
VQGNVVATLLAPWRAFKGGQTVTIGVEPGAYGKHPFSGRSAEREGYVAQCYRQLHVKTQPNRLSEHLANDRHHLGG